MRLVKSPATAALKHLQPCLQFRRVELPEHLKEPLLILRPLTRHHHAAHPTAATATTGACRRRKRGAAWHAIAARLPRSARADAAAHLHERRERGGVHAGRSEASGALIAALKHHGRVPCDAK